MPSLQQLVDLMKKPSASDRALVERAYAFAENAHKDHKRYSGEPYFSHLFGTAQILAELGMSAATIAAGLLHDTLEDVGVQPDALRKEFGEDIFILVDGVTKLGRLRYRGIDRYSEGLRRFFIASAKDIRVIIIKLADRLHNMRTLRFVPEEKRRRIAMETLEIYAPLAYRLGIRKINRELQDLAFPFAYPAEYDRVTAIRREKKSELTRKLERFHKALLKGLVKHGITPLGTAHRIKGMYSLYIKLRSRDWDPEKIYDMLAVRVTVKTMEDCYRALGAVHALWRPLPGRIKDYIAFPKPNGYQSLHTTVFTGDGGTVEIQIRTEDMHRESEYGVAAHFEYKERAGLKEPDPSYIAWAKKLLSALVSWRSPAAPAASALAQGHAKNPVEEAAPRNRMEENGNESDIPAWVRRLGEIGSTTEEKEFWEHLKDDFFKNRVFIFTPKGDVVDLPVDSRPVDFAYAIHSDIGDHMHGAKVNGKLASLDTALKNGDIVEIQTRAASHPTQKWLEVSRTTLAKKHIRAALQKLGNTNIRN